MSDEAQERELGRLARFLIRPGDRFGLGLAIYRDPTVARSLRERLRVELGGQLRIAEVACAHVDGSADLVGRIATASAGVDALFVTGIDRLLLDSGGRPRVTTAIANFNQRRDDLPELISARVVLWVSKAGAAVLSDQVWDLVQVVLSTAEFEAVARAPMAARAVEFDLPQWAEPAPAEDHAGLEAQAERFLETAARSEDIFDSAFFAEIAGRIHAKIGRYAEAIEWWIQSAKWMERGDHLGLALRSYLEAAELMLVRGDATSALTLAERANQYTLPPEHGLEIYAKAQQILARASAAWGDLPRAMGIWWELLRLFRRFQRPYEYAVALGELAELHRQRGDLDEALLIRCDQQLPLLATLEPSDERERMIARAHGGIADVLEQRGALVEALELRQHHQLPVFEQLGPPREHARTLARIADIYEAQGDPVEAERIRQHEVPATAAKPG